MHVLMVHNEYARPSGEEHALRAIVGLLEERGHSVSLFLRSSAELGGSVTQRVKAFFAGVYSPRSRTQMTRVLEQDRLDIVQVQNLYPLLSPSVLLACRDAGVPAVMRCPNYRLLCPNGLHLSKGRACERCLSPGRELWCVLRNCGGGLPKSIGYALRNFVARTTKMILDNVDVLVVLSEFQKRRFVAAGIETRKIEVIPNFVPDSRTISSSPCDAGDTISFIGRLSREKGIECFVEAARAMPNYRFAVAADTTLSVLSFISIQSPLNR